jgi:GEVED domain/Secretion system C-terminal sorting domain/N-terminal domain of BNR-repeat neuraminidase
MKTNPIINLRLAFMLILCTLVTIGYSQVTLFSSGFESGDPTFSSSMTTGTATQPNVGNANSGTNSGKMAHTSNNTSFSGSIITGSTISFVSGRYYTITVSAKVACATSTLKIAKSATATNAAMAAVTGGDQILWPGSANVTSATYATLTTTFLASATESKYVGFQVVSGSAGGCASTIYLDDITIIEYTAPPCGYYCTAGGSNATTGSLTNVTFNTISRASGFDGYVCTGLSTSVQRTVAYTLSIDRNNSATYNLYTQAWIDWNQDGDFADAGEIVLASGLSATTGVVTRTVSITVPSGATLGTTKMRVMMKYNAAPTSTGCDVSTIYMDVEDYDVEVNTAPTNMVYVSSTTTQSNTTSVNAGTFAQEVIGVQITTSGTLNPLNVSSFTFNTAGTTSATNDILNAQLWSSASSSSFATSTQIGSTVANPNGAFTFTTSTTTLLEGTNYFWLTYDVKNSATSPDVIDATCTSLIVGTAQTPTVTAPSGNRPIITASTMAFVSCTTTQNASTCPRPSTNNQIIGVQIVTSGAASPLSATSFSFNTTGTSAVVTTNITNAKLWSTGSSSSFATTTQIGSTVAAPNGTFTITPSATLINGTNYFWLTYDVPSGAGCNPTQIDAQCTSITIASTPRTPTVTSPLGAIVIDCNSAFYSQGNLDMTLLSSWNSSRTGGGSTPGSFSSSSSFYVQNGHTMTTSAAVTIPYLTVEGGGYVKATYLVSCTDLRIKSYGSFEQIVQATNGTYITNFYIENYGTWLHNNAGYLPSGNRYFSPASNQWFYQWGGGTFPAGTSWGNVLLNGTTTGNFGMGGVLTTIQGNFEWRRIGTNNYLLDEQNETINIGGNLIFSGGYWKVAYDNSTPGNQTRTVTINVAGDFIMTSGTLLDYARGATTSGTTLNIDGNVTITGGTLNFNSSGGTASSINLTLGTAAVNWNQTGGTVTLGNTNIKSGKTVTMTGSKIGDLAASRALTLETGSALYCSNYPVTGSGLFTMQSGTTLGIGSAAGITASGATGNVQVSGTRTYHSNATYIYYEGLNQSTGNFVTTTTSGTYPQQVANLIINKTSATNTVTLTSTMDVTSTLTLTSGLVKSGYTAATAPWIRIPSTGTITPVGGSANSYVDGYIRRQGTTDFIFPTGNGGRWARIGMTAPSITTEFEARYIASPYSNVTSMAASPITVLDHVSQLEYWMLNKPLGADAATTKVQLYFESSTWSNILKWDSLSVSRFNGSAWENTNCYSSCPASWLSSTAGSGARYYTGSVPGSGMIQSNTVSSFSPFTFSSVGYQPLNPLPIELLYFKAECKTEKVLLGWETASELNSDFFTIEKSIDGINFIQITTLKAAGTKSGVSRYNYTDNSPLSGTTYYRLKQTDFDGESKIYATVTTTCDAQTSVLAYNNNEGNLVVSINSETSEAFVATVYNTLGSRLFTKTLNTEKGTNNYKLDISSLVPGIYFVSIDNNHKQSTQKFVIK